MVQVIHFLDAIGDGVGLIDLLASFGLFGATACYPAYTGAAMKSMLKKCFL